MKFNQVLKETTLWTKGGGKKTIHSEKRNKFASKNVSLKDYEDAKKGKKAYSVWIRKVRVKI